MLVPEIILMILRAAVWDWIFMTEEYLGRSYRTTYRFLKHQNSEDYDCEMSIQKYISTYVYVIVQILTFLCH